MQILVEATDALSLGNCSISRDVCHCNRLGDMEVAILEFFASFLEDMAFLRSADMEEIQRVQTKMKRLDQVLSAASGCCCDFWSYLGESITQSEIRFRRRVVCFWRNNSDYRQRFVFPEADFRVLQAALLARKATLSHERAEMEVLRWQVHTAERLSERCVMGFVKVRTWTNRN